MEKIFQVFNACLNEVPVFGPGTEETNGGPLPPNYRAKSIGEIKVHYLPQIITQAIQEVNTY